MVVIPGSVHLPAWLTSASGFPAEITTAKAAYDAAPSGTSEADLWRLAANVEAALFKNEPAAVAIARTRAEAAYADAVAALADLGAALATVEDALRVVRRGPADSRPTSALSLADLTADVAAMDPDKF